LKIWDVKTREMKTSIGDHPAAITGVGWAREGKGVIAVTEEGTVRINTPDSASLAVAFTAAGDVLYAMAATPLGDNIFAGSTDGQFTCGT